MRHSVEIIAVSESKSSSTRRVLGGALRPVSILDATDTYDVEAGSCRLVLAPDGGSEALAAAAADGEEGPLPNVATLWEEPGAALPAASLGMDGERCVRDMGEGVTNGTFCDGSAAFFRLETRRG